MAKPMAAVDDDDKGQGQGQGQEGQGWGVYLRKSRGQKLLMGQSTSLCEATQRESARGFKNGFIGKTTIIKYT